MANFCRFCGSPVREGAKFCRNCGRALEVTGTVQKTQKAGRSAVQPSIVPEKSADIAPKQENQVKAAPAKIKEKSPQKPAQKPRSRASAKNVVSTAATSGIVQQVRTIAASASAGEIDFGVLELPGMNGIAEQITIVSGPIAGVFNGIGSYIGGIFRIFKNPLALIGTLALAALYYFLSQNRNSDSEIVKWLSLLTYTEGGFGRGSLDSVQGILGTLGGTLGMGTAAAALFSLFNGGLVRFFKGIGALFTGHGEKRSFISVLFGIILGGAAFFAFAGRNPSEGSYIAGIAGAVLSLEALGGGSGKLYTLAQSLTSKASNGVRTALQGKCDSLLTGLTLGFAIAALVSVIM